MKTTLNIIATSCLVIWLWSCEEVTVIDIKNSETYLVVDGGVFLTPTADGKQFIRLSETVPFFDEDNRKPVTSATVAVSDGTATVVFDHVSDGRYEGVLVPAAGETYTLTVAYNGRTYQATGVMPGLVLAENLQLVYTDLTNDPFADGNKIGYVASIDMQDPAGIKNYYLYKLLVNGQSTFLADPGNRLNTVVEDQYFDGKFLSSVEVNNDWLSQPGDEVEVQLFNISREQYEFYYALFTLTAGNSLLGDPPPAPIQGNVVSVNDPTERVLGFFQVAARSSVSGTVE